MVNAIDLALTEVHFQIPYKLLQLAFMRNTKQFNLSMDEEIMAQVISPRVIKHCNLVGGKYKEIILRTEFWEPIQLEKAALVSNIGQYSVYRIPPEEREGLPLIDVTEVEWPGVQNGYGLPYSGYYSGNSVANAARKMLDSQTFRSTPPKPTVEVLSGDLIRLNPSQHNHMQWVLTCRLAYDDNFMNMEPSAAKVFAELCVEAVKSYIYNTIVIAMDQAYIEAGAELGVVKSTIEEYKESEARFKELLEKFAGMAKYDNLYLKKLMFHCLQ